MTKAGVEEPEPAPWVEWDEFWVKSRTDPEWVVPDVLARRRGHAIWAKGGMGKSEFMQWVCLEAIKAGHVCLYLDYEMIDDDLFDRFSDFGYGPTSDLSRFYYVLIPTLPPLDKREGALALGSLIDRVQAANPGLHVVVLIDTIGRAVVGPENDNSTMLDFYRFTGFELKRREVTWARLDHTGHKEQHARGGSAKQDDVDCVWEHTRTDTGCRLLNHKRRASWIPDRVDFTRNTEPFVTYTRTDYAWPAGTREVAASLDRLDFPVDASARGALVALRDAGEGRAREVVNAAQKYRKGLRITLGITPDEPDGDHSQDHSQKAHSHGVGSPSGSPGITPPSIPGITVTPLGGTSEPVLPNDDGDARSEEDWYDLLDDVNGLSAPSGVEA